MVRRTRLDELIAKFNTTGQAKFYVEHLGADFADYEAEDRDYKLAVSTTQRVLSRMGRVQTVDRGFVPNFVFGAEDTIFVLGQDGLVANVLKYLDGQPVVAINPDPRRWEGVLLPFAVDDLETVVPELFREQRSSRRVTMASVELNTGEVLYGVNDLFIGPRSHTSARYRLSLGERSEEHSSSGIIVSTGLGSTGWMRSVVAGATGIAAALAGQDPAEGTRDQSFPWDAERLFFSVREPWPSTVSSADITCGEITRSRPLELESRMAEHGVIFSDGIEKDFIEFNAGALATVRVAEKKGLLVT